MDIFLAQVSTDFVPKEHVEMNGLPYPVETGNVVDVFRTSERLKSDPIHYRKHGK